MLTFATAIVRAWTWLYTAGLDPDPRDDRRAQIESDIWDYTDDATEQGVAVVTMATHVLARLVLGVPDDLLWRSEQLSARTSMVAVTLGEARSRPVTFRRASGFGVSATVHALLVMFVVWLGPRLTSVAMRRTPLVTPTTIVYVPATDVTGPPPDDRSSNASDVTPDDNLGIRLGDGGATLTIPGFTFNFAKVVNRAGALFPFVTGTRALERIAATALVPRSPQRLINPFGRGRVEGSELPPLSLTPGSMQALVDRAWARRDRWNAFATLVPMVEAHSPSTGDLPALMRAYVEQNGLQPYVDAGIPDPRLWTQLGVVADHADFIDFSSRYLAHHSASRTATELRFLLDTLLQGSYDTLTALLDVIPEEDLRWTRSTNADAYDAMVRIQQHYRAELERRNLPTRASLRLYFDAARISILTNVLETTPDEYRASDARFLIGSIYWRQGRTAEAIATWSQLRVDASDRYHDASAAILDALRSRPLHEAETRRIGHVLDSERGRWVSFSHDRLKQFGFRFNVF